MNCFKRTKQILINELIDKYPKNTRAWGNTLNQINSNTIRVSKKGMNNLVNNKIATSYVNKWNKDLGYEAFFVVNYTDSVEIKVIPPDSIVQKYLNNLDNKRRSRIKNLEERFKLDESRYADIEGQYWVDEEGNIHPFLDGEYYSGDSDWFNLSDFGEELGKEKEEINEELFNFFDRIAGTGFLSSYLNFISKRIAQLEKEESVLKTKLKNENNKGIRNEKLIRELTEKITEINNNISFLYQNMREFRQISAEEKDKEKRAKYLIDWMFKVASYEINNLFERVEQTKDPILMQELNDLLTIYEKVDRIKYGEENPFISDEEKDILLESENETVKYIYDKLRQISNNAIKTKSKLNKIKEEIIVKTLSENKRLLELVKDKDKLLEFLKKPRADISLFDMLMHDISILTFSYDSLLAQEIKRIAMEYFEGEKSEVGKLLNRFEELRTKIEEKLPKIGIPGFTGRDWSIFRQRDKYGSFTERLISPFTSEWHTTMYKRVYSFNILKDKVSKQRDNFLKNETHIVDIRKLSAIKKWLKEKYKETGEEIYKESLNYFEFSDEQMQEYEQQLKNKYDTLFIDQIIEDSISMLDEYITFAKAQIALAEKKIESKKKKYEEFKQKGRKDIMANILVEIEDIKTVTQDMLILKNPLATAKAFNEKQNIQYKNETGEEYSRHITYNIVLPKNEKYLDKRFYEFIASDKDMLSMWRLLKEIFTYINTSFSDATMRLSYDNVPALDKHFIEMLTQHTQKAGVFERGKFTYKELRDKMIEGLRQKRKFAVLAKDKYGINKNFVDNKKKEISEEFRKLQKQWYKLNDNKSVKNIHISNLDSKQFEFLSNLLGISTKEELYKLNNNDNVLEVGKLLYSIARDRVVKRYSQDFPMIVRVAAILAAEYNARVQMKPLIDLLISEYNSIERKRKIKGNKIEAFFARITGKDENNRMRERAVKRMEWWYRKAVLGQYDEREYGIFKGFKNIRWDNKKWLRGFYRFLATGKLYTGSEKEILKQLEPELIEQKNKVRKIINNLDIPEEDKAEILDYINKYGYIKLKQYQDVFKDKVSKEEYEEFKKLNQMQSEFDNLGANFSLSSFFNSIMSYLIFKGLAYNIGSGVINRAEGWIANMLADSTGYWWTPGNFTLANIFMMNAYKARTGNKEAREQWEIFDRVMIDFGILQDASNELQKNSVRSSIRNLDKAMPYYLSVTAVEKRNQGTVVLSLLMDEKIKDKDGNEYPVFDGEKFTAFEIKNGQLRLKDNFRAPENIEKWEHRTSKNFIKFKNKTIKVISHIHGDYSELGGMMIKSEDWGRILMMFKTWLPMYIWQRFHKKQVDIITGAESKGRYRSVTPLLGTTIGAFSGILWGPAFIAAGGALGFLWAVNNGISLEVSAIKQITEFSKMVLKRTFAIPLSLIGKKSKWTEIDIDDVIKKLSTENVKLSKLDAMNLAANAQEVAYLLMLILIKILIKSIGWDDDDDKKRNDWRWKTYLVLENKITGLIENSVQYSNPKALYDQATRTAFSVWLDNVYKTVKYVEDTLEGNPYFESGPYKGQIKLFKQFDRLFIPSFMHTFGFGSYAIQDWSQSDMFDKLLTKHNLPFEWIHIPKSVSNNSAIKEKFETWKDTGEIIPLTTEEMKLVKQEKKEKEENAE